jgi:hypothetical protein
MYSINLEDLKVLVDKMDKNIIQQEEGIKKIIDGVMKEVQLRD